jgi:hypothetical protein
MVRDGNGGTGMRRISLLALAGVMLAGCQTPEERLAIRQSRCEGYGFHLGTDGYAQCLMRLDQEDRALDQRRWQHAIDSWQQAGDSFSAPPAASRIIVPPPVWLYP